MITVHLLLLILALVCFLLSTAGVPCKINLQSLGLALVTLAFLVR